MVEAIPTRLTWANGIGHSLEHMEHGQAQISKLFGGKRVEYCHNPTAMAHADDYIGFVGDLSQATTQKLGLITDEVTQLVSHLQKALAAVGRRGVVVHICHSQGALVTALALRQLKADEMNRLEILAFGGAAVLLRSSATPLKRSVNYYAANDPLLLLVPSAQEALRSGFLEPQFCFLAPREGDPIADHGLLGETYGQALAWEGRRFQQLYQSTLYRTARSLVLLVIALVQWLWLLLQTILQRLLLICVANYQLLASTWELVKSRIVPPILLFLVILADWILDTTKRLSGEKKYLPVSKATTT
jgi:hypothetical protein